MGRDEFRLLHYAGEVNYNVNGEGVCRDTVTELEDKLTPKSGVLFRADSQTLLSNMFTDPFVSFLTPRLSGQEQ